MTDVARPSSGEARVCAAVTLGWQMAKLYHSRGMTPGAT